MKAIYVKPVTEEVNLNLREDINWGEYGGGGHSENVGGANEDCFFDEEEIEYDDDYDPFFDE